MDLLLMWILLIKMRKVYQTPSTIVCSILFKQPERPLVATLRTLVACIVVWLLIQHSGSTTFEVLKTSFPV
jgi:hypothetical protein